MSFADLIGGIGGSGGSQNIVGMAAVLFYYAYLLVGSVSVGYLFLRLTHPEIRVMSKRDKVRSSLMAGGAFVIVAVLVDGLLGLNRVLEANGLTALIASALIILSLVLFNAFSSFKTPYVVVGVSVPDKSKAKQALSFVKEVTVKPAAQPLWQRVTEATKEKPVAPTPAAPKPAPAPAAAHPAALVVVEVKEKEKKEKTGFLARVKNLFSRKPKPAPPQPQDLAPKPLQQTKQPPAAAPVAVAPVAPPAPPAAAATAPTHLPRWIERKKEEEEKHRKEAEVEVILGDLIKEGKIESKDELGHRMYLKKRWEQKQQAQGAKGVEATQKAQKEELNALFQDVYSQLKTGKEAEEKRSGLDKVVGVKTPPQPVPRHGQQAQGKPAAEEKPLSVSDLFGEEAKPATTAAAPPGEKQSSLFAQLADINEGREAKTAKPAPQAHDVEFVRMQAKPGMGCPNCGSRNARIVFCPYCGSGLCANCTPSLKPSPEAFVYTCPKCGEEIAIKKKAPAPAATMA